MVMQDSPRRYPSYRDEAPKLIGGARCLDFLNTVEWRGDPDANGERLVDYDEFVVWAGRTGYLDAQEQASGRRIAKRQPGKAKAALADAILLRERIVDVIARRAGAVAAFNAALRRLQVAVELAEEDGTLRTRPAGGDILRAPLSRIALDAVELLTSARLAQVRSCGNARCGWFFLDLSRNKSRRWCDMAACGNNAKARAHYHRHHGEHA
jgi:predicted RNA-binding Zn ribbon-like protein